MKQASNEITDSTHKMKSDVKEIIFKEAETISSQVRDEITKAMDEWHSARIKIENELSQKVRKADLIDFKNEVNKRIEPKVEIGEVQSALNALQTEIANRLVNTKIELQNTIGANQEYVSHQLSKKLDNEELHNILTSKVDSHQLHQLLELKSNRCDVESFRDTIDRVIREIDSKATLKELQSHVDYTRSSIEDMTREINFLNIHKAKAKEVTKLAEEKVSKDEVDKIYETLCKELQDKVSNAEVKNTFDEQALINEALCSENCIGRWVWKSGELKASCLIPWEIQCVNTCPDNFVWEKNKTSVI
jgi:hypothetical protein